MTDLTSTFYLITYMPGVYYLTIFLLRRWGPLDSFLFPFWICWWFVLLADRIIPPKVLTITETINKYPELWRFYFSGDWAGFWELTESQTTNQKAEEQNGY